MIPTNSNTAAQGCSPVSSNCVIWQGPNITCINLCTGDSVSEVVYKLATEVCAMKAQLDLSDVDFDCLVSSAIGTPEPEHNLTVAITLLVNKVCELNDIVNAFQNNDGSINLDFAVAIPSTASCFVKEDINGDPVFSLPHSEFTKDISKKVCALNTLVNQHTGTLSNHESRIIALETYEAASQDLMVTPICVLPTSPDVPITTAFESLEQQFCNLRSITGMPTALSAALTFQCQGLGAEKAFSTTGTMSSIPGWKAPVTTVADALQNMWLTLCDMRAGLKDIAINGGGTAVAGFNCSSIIVNFSVATNEERTQATVFFAGLVTIPDGVTDCTSQGAKITFTDSANNKSIQYVNVTANKTNTLGTTFTLTGLNPALAYTAVLEGCFSKDGSQCSKVVTKQVPVSCQVVTNVTAVFV